MPSELANEAIALLSPTIGDFLAKAKVQAACNMTGLDIETLDRTQLNVFLPKFESICAFDLGENVSKSVVAKLKRT